MLSLVSGICCADVSFTLFWFVLMIMHLLYLRLHVHEFYCKQPYNTTIDAPAQRVIIFVFARNNKNQGVTISALLFRYIISDRIVGIVLSSATHR